MKMTKEDFLKLNLSEPKRLTVNSEAKRHEEAGRILNNIKYGKTICNDKQTKNKI